MRCSSEHGLLQLWRAKRCNGFAYAISAGNEPNAVTRPRLTSNDLAFFLHALHASCNGPRGLSLQGQLESRLASGQ